MQTRSKKGDNDLRGSDFIMLTNDSTGSMEIDGDIPIEEMEGVHVNEHEPSGTRSQQERLSDLVYTGTASSNDTPIPLTITQDSSPSTAASDEWQHVAGGETKSQSSCGTDMSIDFDSDDDVMCDPEVPPFTTPFDVGLLKRSIENGSATLDQVEDKDVVLVVGKTGTGKSTFIQAVAGKRIKSVDHVMLLGSENDFHQVYEAEDPLDGFEIGHSKLSETRSIKGYEHSTNKGTKLLFVDSPGFEDTDGHEMDIATSIMLTEVAKRCKSLRFVVLINFVSFLEDRGGSVAAVLRFVGSFVKDFESDKKSFMFLFSHTNEMKDVTCIDDATKKVHREIKRMLEVKQEARVSAVLKFMRKSVERKYLFVNVFNPLTTDIDQVLKFIESQVKPVQSQTFSSNCGLTTTSKLKLVGEVDKLSIELQRQLSSPEMNIDKIFEISDTLEYLQSRIAVEDVREAASRCAKAIYKFCCDTKEFIDSQLSRASDLEHEFHEKDRIGLLDAIRRYDRLSGKAISIDYILRRLNELTDCKIPSCFGSSQLVALKLRKLRVWVEESPKFRQLYDQTVHRLKGALEEIMSLLVSCSVSSVFQDEEHIRTCLEHCAILDAITPFVDDLAQHPLPVHDAIQVSTDLESVIMLEILSWENELQNMENRNHPVDLPKMLTYAEKLQSLNTYAKPPSQRLKDTVDQVSRSFETQIVAYFEEVASNSSTEQFLAASGVNTLLKLNETARGFAKLDGLNLRQLIPVVERVVHDLCAKARGLEAEIQRQSESIRELGFPDGRLCASLFLEFNQFMFLDELLDERDTFMRNLSISLHRPFTERMSKVEQTVEKVLSNLVEANTKTTKTGFLLDNLVGLLPEVEAITEFSLGIGNKTYSTFGERVQSKLELYLDLIKNSIEQNFENLKSLTISAEDPASISDTTEALDDLLGILDKLGNSPATHEIRTIAKSIEQTTTSNLKELATSMIVCFDDETPNFHLLAKQLLCVKAFGVFNFTKKRLPDYSQLTLRATELVSVAAESVERMIDTSTCWDDIDRLLSRLQEAEVLDMYTRNQASSRLGLLKKLLEKKGEDVDTTVETMIRDNNFRGLGELIIPLSKSTDQLKRKKFDHYSDNICSQIQDVERKLKHSFDTLTRDTAPVVLQWMEILANADSELGNHLRSKLRVDRVIGSAKQKLNAAMKRRTEKFLRTVKKSLNFTQMAIETYETSNLADQFKSFLFRKTAAEVDEMVEQYEVKKREISDHVKNFFTCKFSQGSRLLMVLSSLQKATEDQHEAMKELSCIYASRTTEITDRLIDTLTGLARSVEENSCYSDGVTVLSLLIHELDNGLSQHIDVSKLPFDCKEKMVLWKQFVDKEERDLLLAGVVSHQDISDLCQNLQRKRERSQYVVVGWLFKDYEEKCSILRRESEVIYDKGANALQSRDFAQIRESMEKLYLVSSSKLYEHVPSSRQLYKQLETEVQTSFLSLLEASKDLLCQNQTDGFKSSFADLKGFALYLRSSFSLSETQTLFTLVSQLVFDKLEKRISHLKCLLSFESDDVDFLKIRSQVEEVRDFGGFVADQYTLLFEEVKVCKHEVPQKWLAEISNLCHNDFREGRNLSNIKLYAILGVVPSASKAEIRRAYHNKARIHHPDKSAAATAGIFRQIKEAHDKLVDAEWSPCSSKPFDQLIRRVGESLRMKVKALLHEERYDTIESLLCKIPALAQLEDLVEPKLPCATIRADIESFLGDHVKSVRTKVQSLWAERKYRELNESIEDLQTMEHYFKSYQNIFPDSWNDGIVKTIEDNIRELGKEARGILVTQRSAQDNKTEFRHCILRMGCILVDLPLFHTFTKDVMSEVLECSLKNDWGFAFLFDLGLSLRRGDEDTEDEARVAYQILSEFSHFKEIETMCWNTETTQKPAEDTVLGIRAKDLCSEQQCISIDQGQLLQSFSIFESEYKTLLGEYLRPESDRDELAQRTIAACHQAKPVSCEGAWDDRTKAVLPKVLAGVFALFTVSKSGDSFERVNSSGEDSKLGDQAEKVLMKPHNIQVLTLLYMFGCDSLGSDSLSSQLLRIRTGEGKSIILGAAACVLALFGFKVRCVCYSEYLSCRDYGLFKDIFHQLGLHDNVTYSKITTLSEDTTVAKGDIRKLTNSLLHGKLSIDFPGQANESQLDHRRTRTRSTCESSTRGRKRKSNDIQTAPKTRALLQSVGKWPMKNVVQEEILLVDEVDVFFGSDFYGQTYNQVVQVYEPEIRQILELIWKTHKESAGKRQHLSAVTSTHAYQHLLGKMASFKGIIDNELSLMLDQVRRVNDEPYFLRDGKIGYKDMDTINYNITYGYRTTFAYLQEYDAGKLDSDDLANALCMNVSCGQFSYANIQPTRIMGVSGTLEAMGDFEKDVLMRYGIKKFVFMPSVYGKSNFDFQKAGEGLFIESNSSDFFHKLCSEISKAVKKKRAVIVFFRDTVSLLAFEKSAFYRQLGRQKSKLVEDMAPEKKDFVIKKAATAGQITICSASFGRGTDFFCKDQRVQDNGGVHVIQTFLSTELSEEIQIQGRTARQGKEGTYQMILLGEDLKRDFGLSPAELEQMPKSQWYDWLSAGRNQKYKGYCEALVDDLKEATKRDHATQQYFDALLALDEVRSCTMLEDIYFNMKKAPMPSRISIDLCFAVDVSGSMNPYMVTVEKTISSLLEGQTSIGLKLRSKFPEIDFEVRTAVLGFRDIDDMGEQFCEALYNQSHFMDDARRFGASMKSVIQNTSGGHDLAEDILGALYRCACWSNPMDWSSDIKFVILFTDAPAHGMVPPCSVDVPNADFYSTLHPEGLTTEKVADALLAGDIDLFCCSFNPGATEKTEASLINALLGHKENVDKKEITRIPMTSQRPQSGSPILISSRSQHIVFVLDESGSMSHSWSGVVKAYQDYLACRMQNQNMSDLASVVQFDGNARTAFELIPIQNAPPTLGYNGGGTRFSPAASLAYKIVLSTPATHEAVVVFMSDGLADEGDAQKCASIFSSLNAEYRQQRATDLKLHVIAFGAGLDQRQLQQIMHSTPNGKIHTTLGSDQLSNVFVDIASSSKNVGALLEKEIGRRISDAVADKLVLEYLR